MNLISELKDRRDEAMREIARCQLEVGAAQQKWEEAEKKFDELDTAITAWVRYENYKAERAQPRAGDTGTTTDRVGEVSCEETLLQQTEAQFTNQSRNAGQHDYPHQQDVDSTLWSRAQTGEQPRLMAAVAQEPIVDRSFTVREFMDEMPPHGPTLADAANFLLHGPTEVFGEWTGPAPPFAKDGDTVELHVLEFYADRHALRNHDGSWRIEPAIPADATIIAVRYGPGMGWNPEHIAGDVADLQNIIHSLEESGDTILEDIAVARSRDINAIFHVIDGVPSLTLAPVNGKPAREDEGTELTSDCEAVLEQNAIDPTRVIDNDGEAVAAKCEACGEPLGTNGACKPCDDYMAWNNSPEAEAQRAGGKSARGDEGTAEVSGVSASLRIEPSKHLDPDPPVYSTSHEREDA